MNQLTEYKANKGILALLWVMAIGIVAYWVSYFTEGSVHASNDTCYHVFERNFPAPDAMVALMCMLCAEGLRRSKTWAIFTGMSAVGGLLFLALIDISYNIWNDMYAIQSGAMGAEIFINIICLGSAAGIAFYLWQQRNRLS